jgi:hypothetical protein
MDLRPFSLTKRRTKLETVWLAFRGGNWIVPLTWLIASTMHFNNSNFYFLFVSQ